MESPVVVRTGLVRGLVRRRWLSVLLATVLGGALGLAADAALPTTYSSTASLFLEPLGGNPFSPTTAATRNEQIAALQTEVALLSTTEVARLARERAPELPDDAVDGVTASVPSNSQVVLVTYAAATPELAQAGAEAFGEAFLAYRQDRSERVRDEQSAVLQEQVAETTALLQEATGRLAEAEEGTAQYVQLQQEVQLYASRGSDLQVQLLALGSAAANPGEVISPARVPTAPDGLPAVLLVLAGLLVGAVAGAFVGLFREHTDPRLHTVDEVAQLGTGPAVALLPDHARQTGTAAPDHDEGPAVDGHRTLAASVLAALPPTGGVVTVVGADPAATSADVAIGLSRALVRSGHLCTLLLSELTSSEAGSTLAEFVAEHRERGAGPAATEAGSELSPGLRLVAAQPPGADDRADDLLQHDQTYRFLQEVAGSGRVVVVAAPAMPRGAALSLARYADQAVLLVRLGRTRFDVAESDVDRLRRAGVQLLGTAAQTGGQGRHGRRDTVAAALQPPEPAASPPGSGEAEEDRATDEEEQELHDPSTRPAG